MDQFIAHTHHSSKVNIPPSKSFAQRAILAASLCESAVNLQNLGNSADVRFFLNMSKQLGAIHSQAAPGVLTIQGFQNQRSTQLNTGESGLGLRLITSICAVLGSAFEIIGEGSLRQRPIGEFEDLLSQIGVSCTTKNGFLPLYLQGKARGGIIKMDGSSGSQYLTGLLMALPLADEDSEIHVSALTSRPYVDITLAILADFGITIEHQNYAHFKIKGGQHYYRNQVYTVESDYSGAANWMVHGAITKGISITGLNTSTKQGDAAMLKALAQANVAHTWRNNVLEIAATEIIPFDFDATECPDLFPALVVLAAAAKGQSKIKGANRLLHKESNRAKVLVEEFSSLGLNIQHLGDLLLIEGNGKLESGTIKSHNDHRIAMAGAIAAALTTHGITIQEAESVEKSYPHFWNEFK